MLLLILLNILFSLDFWLAFETKSKIHIIKEIRKKKTADCAKLAVLQSEPEKVNI